MVKPLLLLPAVFFFGLATANSAAAFQDTTKPAEVPAHAKQVYKFDCAMCHGDTGDGKTDLATSMNLTMTDFTDPKTLGSKTDKELFDMIRKGTDKMPPEDAARAKDADIHGLVLYIRSMSNGHTSPAAPAPAAPPAATPAAASASAKPGR